MNSVDNNHPSILFIGHFAIDNIIRFKKQNKPTLGGSVTFCSLALRKYTQDVNIKIFSHLGTLNFKDSLLKIIENKDINLQGIKYSEVNNTNFLLDYYNHTRTLTLKSRSPDLEFSDIPQAYLNSPPDVIVLVPLCNEISPSFVSQIVKTFPDAYVGIDLQGFIRKINDSGIVSYVHDDNLISNMKNIINIIGNKLILKGSEEEMKLLSGRYDNCQEVMNHFHEHYNDGIFIMTLGEGGSMVIKKGEKLLEIPAF
ncbi:MAG: hypothetical protein EU539_09705, partial [Promethearchaeota archaeon]